MGSFAAELQRAIARLQFLKEVIRDMQREIAYLKQQLRDARGG